MTFWLILCACILCLFIFWYIKGDADFFLLFCELLLSYQWFENMFHLKQSLQGKVVWITGASSGIGEALAHELARYGCKLILSARRAPLLVKVKQRCLQIQETYQGKHNSEDIMVLPMDLTNIDTHDNLLQMAISHFGRIDILVNNAGCAQQSESVKTPSNIDQSIMDINFFSTVKLTLKVIEILKKQKEGHIVYVSSALGNMSCVNCSTYIAAKHAAKGYFHGLRNDLTSHNISVMVACPGPVKSEGLEKAFTEQEGVTFGDMHELCDNTHRMNADRCGQLIVVAVIFKMYEAWISPNPVLFYTYVAQYCPLLFHGLLAPNVSVDSLKAEVKREKDF